MYKGIDEARIRILAGAMRECRANGVVLTTTWKDLSPDHEDYIYLKEGQMHYCIGDIHNDHKRFSQMLKLLNLRSEDHVYLLGDLFDRNLADPDPVGVYFTMLKLGNQCTVIRGNHDQWLAEYIFRYYNTPEKRRKKLWPYPYNSFDLMAQRLTSVDMLHLAELILQWPLQAELEVEGEKYLLAHAQTFLPDSGGILQGSKMDCLARENNRRDLANETGKATGIVKPEDYLMGNFGYDDFLKQGVDGYISVCGHNDTGNGKIWKNTKANVYVCDCGCGFADGKLGCLCLETKEEFYV